MIERPIADSTAATVIMYIEHNCPKELSIINECIKKFNVRESNIISIHINIKIILDWFKIIPNILKINNNKGIKYKFISTILTLNLLLLIHKSTLLLELLRRILLQNDLVKKLYLMNMIKEISKIFLDQTLRIV